MTTATMSLRKAAILVASLDRQTADTLLEHLAGEQADVLRRMILSLDAVDRVEECQALREFLGLEADGDPEPSDDLPRQKSAPQPNASAAAAPDPPDTLPELASISDEMLAEFLGNEQPQTIAAVLSCLPAERTSEIIARLPQDLQARVLQRFVDVDTRQAPGFELVRQDLQEWLESRIQAATQRARLIARVSDFLRGAESDTRQRILQNLATSDQRLAVRLGFLENTPPASAQANWSAGERPERPAASAAAARPASLEVTQLDPVDCAVAASWGFEQMGSLDHATLADLIAHVPTELLALALTGAEPHVINRVLKALPSRARRPFRRSLDLQGPLRIADIDLARQQIEQFVNQRLDHGPVMGHVRGLATS